jgi:predicted membrane protein
VTGFGFPVDKFLPSHAFGIISLVLLLLVILARYTFHLAGAWRWIYALGLVITVYLDAFVAVVQAFLKIPALHALAPAGSEPPFAIAQGVLLVVFVVLAIMAAKRFHPEAARAAPAT